MSNNTKQDEKYSIRRHFDTFIHYKLLLSKQETSDVIFSV